MAIAKGVNSTASATGGDHNKAFVTGDNSRAKTTGTLGNHNTARVAGDNSLAFTENGDNNTATVDGEGSTASSRPMATTTPLQPRATRGCYCRQPGNDNTATATATVDGNVSSAEVLFSNNITATANGDNVHVTCPGDPTCG